MDYVFMTDASCDLDELQVAKAGVRVIPMEFQIGDKCFLHYPDRRMMSLDVFYQKLKSGASVKTSQINYSTFKTDFENYLKAGMDILYTGISTGLSGTFNTCRMAVEELREQYPDRKIIIIDSLCDSAGLGYLIYLAGIKYKNGATIEELAEFIEDTRLKICHWFVVDDLDQLKKGGRISAVTATFGKALQIKPLITVDNEGRLVNVGKVRGKSNVTGALIDRLKRDGIDSKKAPVFIAHADNIEGAKELQKSLKGKYKDIQVCEIGPVIGAHVGSGMLAILFLGKRNLK